MKLNKGHLLLFGVLIFICVGSVLWAMRDTKKQSDIEEQMEVAEKSQVKQENKDRTERKKILGLTIPSYEEVERLLTTTDTTDNQLAILKEEYGAQYADYIFTAYHEQFLPSILDNELESKVKHALIRGVFVKGTYPYATNLYLNDYFASEPYATTQQGFYKVADDLLAGYLTTGEISMEGESNNKPMLTVSVMYLPTKDMTLQAFDDLVTQTKVTYREATVPSFLEELRNYLGRHKEEEGVADSLASLTSGAYATLHSIVNLPENTTKAEEIEVAEGTPIIVQYIVTFEPLVAENMKEFDIYVGKQAFKLQAIDTSFYAEYQITQIN